MINITPDLNAIIDRETTAKAEAFEGRSPHYLDDDYHLRAHEAQQIEAYTEELG